MTTKARESLLIKLQNLRQAIDNLPDNFHVLPKQVQHILKTAPQGLSALEDALHQEGHQQNLLKIQETFNQMEVFLQWALGLAGGKSIEDSIKSGKAPDPKLPVQKRLNHRITQFMIEYIDREKYEGLVKEFCGEDAVQGNIIYMDPTRETEAFSQWIMYDKVLPNLSKRLIDLFADKVMSSLYPDEKELLESQLQDRPSIYRVIKLYKDSEGLYLVRDILSREETFFKIKDLSTSRVLNQGATFIGRAIPIIGEQNTYGLMGSISHLPEELWRKISPSINQWKEQYFSENSNTHVNEFFRIYHSRIQNLIYH